MDSLRSPSGSGKRGSRNISHPLRRVPTTGPLDAGPLDDSDPLSQDTARSPSIDAESEATSPEPQHVPTPDPMPRPALNVDLQFLKDPSGYHRIGTEDTPAAFLGSPHQPPQDTPLTELLQHGHFRRAAGAALIELSRCAPDDAETIFQLLYTRLACLALISRADLAAIEAATLTDYLARNGPGADVVTPIIPWELRVLLVRLQSIAASDGGRRGIMAIYALSAEVRANVRAASDADDISAITLWSDRLRDLGLRVADTLVEMGELDTATRHLESLPDIDRDELAYRKAILRLRIGDVEGAKRIIDNIKDEARKAILNALLTAATNSGQQIIQTYQDLAAAHPEDASLASNLAVSLLYAGQLPESRQTLELLVANQPTFGSALFNLSTIYELCTDHAVERKLALAETVAAKAPGCVSGGWERSNFEFKL